MAKYCEKCGKPLPEEAVVCPDCSTVVSADDEAALFTRMTAETEVWKSVEPVKENAVAKKLRGSRDKILMYSAAVVLIVIAAVLILVSQPAARVVRALNKGEVERAYEIYWNSSRLAGGERVEKIDKALLDAADRLCSQYAEHSIDAESAASQLSMLGGFGAGAAELLEPTYEEFRSYNSSQVRMDAAESLFRDGEYLEARKAYLEVKEGDAYYDEAVEKAGICLARYGESVADSAAALMDEERYAEAIATLKTGNRMLFLYDTFSSAIDLTLQECCERFEQFILDEAAALAEQENYDAALERVQAGMKDYGSETERLLQAEAEYTELANGKHVANAKADAEILYAQGDYAGAFALLEELEEQPELSEAAAVLIADLEQTYADEVCGEAEACFDGQRDNLPDAIGILDEALEIRELDGVRAYREELAQYLPLSLAVAEYSGKDGTVFRNDSKFESLDGAVYSSGWLWGENGAEISFALDGVYDELTCVFATRRDDNVDVSGWFEVWCDGNRIYQSEKLAHTQKDAKLYKLDVSGCKELKLVFGCNYEASTAENGYCYHGLCNVELTKNMDAAAAGE